MRIVQNALSQTGVPWQCARRHGFLYALSPYGAHATAARTADAGHFDKTAHPFHAIAALE